MTTPENEPEKKEKHISEKLSESFESVRKNETIDKIISYAKGHTLDSVAYLLLIIGIIWSFFHPFYGGMLVGILGGLYLSLEITRMIKEAHALVDKHGISKSLVFSGLALTLFIMAPGVVIGMAISVSLKQVIKPDR